MPSKPNASAGPASGHVPLTWISALRIAGPDAADFLQRQTMNDVRTLNAIGDWQWNGVLSPKGRVLYLFALLRVAPDGFVLAVPHGDGDALQAHLGRMVFRSKLRVVGWQAQALGLWQAEALPAHAAPARAEAWSGGWLLDVGSRGRRRQLWLGEAVDADFAALLAGLPERSPHAWQAEDLRHGLPPVAGTCADAYTPQMLALDRLAAFSVKKGCYPGQEIVARTHFLGQAKRRLARLDSSEAFADRQPLHAGGTDAEVLAHASDGDAHVALAVLPVEPSEPVWQREHAAPAQRVPFIDGLDRRAQ